VTTATHPGTITYVDGATGAVVNAVPATEVPESLRFIERDGRLVPVVRVVMNQLDASRREIEEYGPNEELLRRTQQVRR
jgi:hypothetical protein